MKQLSINTLTKIKKAIRRFSFLDKNRSCFFVFCAILAGLSSCVQEVGEEFRFTAKDDQVTSFLRNDTLYSEFAALLDSAGMTTLLSARGYYTCFVPTNEAMRTYYQKQETSLDKMSKEERQQLAYTHLISGSAPSDVISSDRFPNGSISLATMNDVFLEISIDTIPGKLLITVNKTATIIHIDQKVHNGVIHTINNVLSLITTSLNDKIEENLTGPYSLFYEALRATGLADTLDMKVNNNLYDETRLAVTNNDFKIATKISYESGKLYETPAYCKYGFTVLRESNETYKNEGIETFDDLVAYAKRAYPEGAAISDPKDSRSSLYRFMAYHIIDRNLFKSEFIPNERYEYYTADTLYEYIETLCPNTLMEVVSINGVPVFNRRSDTGTGVEIISDNEQTLNATFYEINRMLTYEGVEEQVLNKRLRMDVASLMPELATNKARFILATGSFPGYIVPQNYFKNLTYTESTQLHYIGSSSWGNCEGDEFLFVGKYDFRLRIPPVPAGTYEVRIGYTANPQRAVSQLYLDNFPCGIPLDMRIEANHVQVGWIKDSETTDNGAENDKMMRNRGYMKGPASMMMKSSKTILRDNSQALRRIVATVTWNNTEAHELRIKSVEDDQTRQFHLDFIELVPNSIWENEGRD
jgi:uncharacterized surface protein with fasciclin (FAS1) repeats